MTLTAFSEDESQFGTVEVAYSGQQPPAYFSYDEDGSLIQNNPVSSYFGGIDVKVSEI